MDHNNMGRNSRCLPQGWTLNKRYHLDRVLAEDGTGISYLAQDSVTGMQVTVREYFPANLASRDTTNANAGNQMLCHLQVFPSQAAAYHSGLEDFARVGSNLPQMNDQPGQLRATDFFYENETAYLVTEFSGESAGNVPQKNGKSTSGNRKAVVGMTAALLCVVCLGAVLWQGQKKKAVPDDTIQAVGQTVKSESVQASDKQSAVGDDASEVLSADETEVLTKAAQNEAESEAAPDTVTSAENWYDENSAGAALEKCSIYLAISPTGTIAGYAENKSETDPDAELMKTVLLSTDIDFRYIEESKIEEQQQKIVTAGYLDMNQDGYRELMNGEVFTLRLAADSEKTREYANATRDGALKQRFGIQAETIYDASILSSWSDTLAFLSGDGWDVAFLTVPSNEEEYQTRRQQLANRGIFVIGLAWPQESEMENAGETEAVSEIEATAETERMSEDVIASNVTAADAAAKQTENLGAANTADTASDMSIAAAAQAGLLHLAMNPNGKLENPYTMSTQDADVLTMAVFMAMTEGLQGEDYEQVNASLDKVGLLDVDQDGMREDTEGNDFTVDVCYINEEEKTYALKLQEGALKTEFGIDVSLKTLSQDGMSPLECRKQMIKDGTGDLMFITEDFEDILPVLEEAGAAIMPHTIDE